jgi:hypothetical protein
MASGAVLCPTEIFGSQTIEPRYAEAKDVIDREKREVAIAGCDRSMEATGGDRMRLPFGTI